MIIENALELIGGTPLLRAHAYDAPGRAAIYVKLEKFNLTGSVKDRALLSMVEEMERRGELRPGDTLIEPTSGNTGIAMAAVCRMKGYRTVIVMPDTMSRERRDLIAAYGAELILTDGKLGMVGAIRRAEELIRERGYKVLGQFDNPDNALAHYRTTAEEIFADLPGTDAFVAGVGTGGTVSGTGERLKELKKTIEVVAVEPDESAVISGEAPAPHGIQGIGAGFVPRNYRPDAVDRVERVTTEAARQAAREFAEKEGILVGISAGAALVAGIRTAERLGTGKKVVVLAPDGGEKYISMGLFK